MYGLMSDLDWTITEEWQHIISKFITDSVRGKLFIDYYSCHDKNNKYGKWITQNKEILEKEGADIFNDELGRTCVHYEHKY